MKTSRPYQEAALTALFQWFSTNDGNPLVVAPVGAGKSLLIAEFIRRVHESAPSVKIVVVTHVKELLVQNVEELLGQYPTADIGFYCAGLGEKKMHNTITFASIQSVYKQARSFPRAPQIILVDEAHLISRNEDTQYRRFFDECLEINPNCKVIGMTGTPFRADSGRLDEGKGRFFDGVAYEIEMAWMVEQGYWVRPITPKTNTVLSVEGVRIVNGDYAIGQLEQAVDIDEKTQSCVREIINHGQHRKKWLIFTAGVQHCEHVRDALRAQGVIAEMVTGETPKDQRDATLARFRRGEIRAIVNVAVLTTGFNVPEIDLLAFMRPTRSPVLYIQCCGRGVRTVYANGHDLNTKEGRLAAIASSDKRDCLVLDFGNIISTLGPLDQVEIRKKPPKDGGEEKGKAPLKVCPSCGEMCYAAQRYCFVCSYAFPVAEIDGTAQKNAALLGGEPEDHEIVFASFTLHTKRNAQEGDKPMMRATYTAMGGTFSEYIFFEHIGFARKKAEKWAGDRLPNWPIPSTIEEAVKMPWPTPDRITVRKDGKYWRVVDVHLPETWIPPTPTEALYDGAQTIDLGEALDDDIPF